MLIRDPCKRCVVRACCKERCHKRQDYWDTRVKISDIAVKLLMISIASSFLFKVLSKIF